MMWAKLDWKKILTTLSTIIAAVLAALAARNGTVVSMAAGADGEAVNSLWGAWTSLPGFGAVGSLVFAALLSWRQTGTLSKSRIAEIAALTTLSATCLAAGDTVGNDLVSKLAAHFKQLDDAVKPIAVEVK